MVFHGLQEVFDELYRGTVRCTSGRRMIEGGTDVVLPLVILFQGLALATPAQLCKFLFGLVCIAELEGVRGWFGQGRPLDVVELMQKIGYRCIGLL